VNGAGHNNNNWYRLHLSKCLLTVRHAMIQFVLHVAHMRPT
jgi:hypothetical protein